MRASNADPAFMTRRLAGLRNTGFARKRYSGPAWQRGRIPVPTNTHPLVRKLIEEMNAQRTTQAEVQVRAGLSTGMIRSWRMRSVPKLDMFEAALNTIGLELVIRRRRDS